MSSITVAVYKLSETFSIKGGNPDLVVMGEDSCPKVVGSNPSTVYWMDIFAHLFVVKLKCFSLKRQK